MRPPVGPAVRLHGRVQRQLLVDGQSPGFVVTFDRLSPDAEDQIEDLVARQFIEGLRRVVVVTDAHSTSGRAVSRALRQLGHTVVRVDTPLELVKRLEDSTLAVDTVVLAGAMGTRHALEAASFLAEHYPHIRRVLVGHSSGRRRLRFPEMVHAYLSPPWNAHVLAQVL